MRKKWNIQIKMLSFGTSKAIAAAQRGDADLLLVHAREKEDLFIKQEHVNPLRESTCFRPPLSEKVNINRTC